MGQVNISKTQTGSFKVPAPNKLGIGFDNFNNLVRVNADGSETIIGTGVPQVPNIVANLGVGLIADLPDVGSVLDNSIYVTTDTFQVFQKFDAISWGILDLLESQYITDTTVNPPHVYQFAGGILLKIVDTSQQIEGAVLYYLEHSASDIATYEQLLRIPVTIVEEIETVNINANTVLFDAYATEANNPGASAMPAGLWIMHAHVQFSSVTGNNFVHWDIYKRTAAGVETFIFRMSSADIAAITLQELQYEAVQAGFAMADTDRLVLKIYAETTGGAKTASLHYGGIDNFAFVQTPLLAITTTAHNNTTGKELAGVGVTWGHITDQSQNIAGQKIFSGKVGFGAVVTPNNEISIYAGSAQLEVACSVNGINNLAEINFKHQLNAAGYSSLYTAGSIKVLAANNWTSASLSSRISDMLFFVNNTSGVETEMMRLTSAGRLGIKKTVPATELEVVGKIRSGNGATLGFDFYGNGASGHSYIDSLIDDSSYNTYIRCRVSGTPVNQLIIFGTGAATFISTVTATNFILSSDKNLKTNIIEIKDKGIALIEIKSFRLKADKDKRLRYGVIAQEVEEIYPELVYTDEKGIKSVSAIDFLFARIHSLENRLKN